VSGRRNFYLVSFKQDCNKTAVGCLPGDLYTLHIERDWRSVVLQDDEDLKNTPLDCRQCHQRKLEKPTLLMRELQGPWQHFFFADLNNHPYTEGEGPIGRELVRDYLAAKGDESFAGVPIARLRQTAGVTLQLAVPQAQPLVFDPSVTDQLEGNARDGGVRRSGLWDNGFARFKRGEHMALPFYEQRATDPKKQAALAASYTRYRKGELPREQLPDLADIFPDDAQVRAEIGLQTEPNATPAQTLVQACGSCHNDVLDQTISRARFNIALSRMSRDEIDVAIARIELDTHEETAMPPNGMRQLDPEGKKRLLAYLRQNLRSAEDDALLESAAKAGMSLHGFAY
jgi:mono/diheme cytochrome c family protein